MKVDLLIIGGGISGAGIALEAAKRGVKALLVEREDFAWGTSSRSSKLVHGGLRYLKQGALHLTWESVRERDQLLRDAPGLVEPMPFAMAHNPGAKPGRATLQAGLMLYDLLAGRRTRGYADAAQMQWLVPGLPALSGASLYEDATTDDARLTLRVLQEAQSLGTVVRNRTELLALRRDATGQVIGASLRGPDGFSQDIECRCAIAATGAYLGELAAQTGLPAPKIRPLRGSHLLLPLWRLPLSRAVAWSHADDGRPVFAYPWQGALLVGTTDLDHPDLSLAPRITAPEQDYLLRALNQAFPQAGLSARDIRSTWAGVRPVLDSGAGVDPSKESREHLVLAHQGLVAISGGKLTTFRRMAREALAKARPWLPMLGPETGPGILLPAAAGAGIPARLSGRFGARATEVLAQGRQPLWGQTLTGELRHSLQHEQVHHLDDLLLRRTRLGLLASDFGRSLLPALQPHCQQLLGWDAARFEQECQRYLALMHDQHKAL
ncbi:glycerol-3-phosphate dehydrogenase [Inhella inkyongensis]|uniref:Glycerol-3-phosphate dehydrogenase n=1 Tax=Inhella inkyongensis TaxID=392593 RepID=A0A840S1A0_9BURK|nr:glycerol-3-phosphate dehydrogenase/oxidase [Inhella inkyongensis]MBB5202856.1 glycerol-3-phosphate dehydrogenase [Inhella inkyongensis]